MRVSPLICLAATASATVSTNQQHPRQAEPAYLSSFYGENLDCTGPVKYTLTEDLPACINVDLNAGGSVAISKWSEGVSELWLYPEENCMGLPVTNLDQSSPEGTRECYKHTVAAKSWSIREQPWWEFYEQ